LANRCPPYSPQEYVPEDLQALVEAIKAHLEAAREAAQGKKPPELEESSIWFYLFHWS
jgi:hypothetical protein